MGRIYSVSFSEVSVTAQQDLFQIEAITTPVIIHAVYISQSSDVGDSAAASVSIQLRRFTDTVTNDLAEVKLDGGDAAANANLAINETTELVADSEVIHSEAWNVAMPFVFLPPPELRPLVQISNGLAVNMNTTDSLTMSGTMYFEEIGS